MSVLTAWFGCLRHSSLRSDIRLNQMWLFSYLGNPFCSYIDIDVEIQGIEVID